MGREEECGILTESDLLGVHEMKAKDVGSLGVEKIVPLPICGTPRILPGSRGRSFDLSPKE